MRKLLIVLLSIMLLIGLSACSSENKANNNYITVHYYDNTYYIYVNHIVAISSTSDNFTDIDTDKGGQYGMYRVQEKPDEIINMIKEASK